MAQTRRRDADGRRRRSRGDEATQPSVAVDTTTPPTVAGGRRSCRRRSGGGRRDDVVLRDAATRRSPDDVVPRGEATRSSAPVAEGGLRSATAWRCGKRAQRSDEAWRLAGPPVSDDVALEAGPAVGDCGKRAQRSDEAWRCSARRGSRTSGSATTWCWPEGAQRSATTVTTRSVLGWREAGWATRRRRCRAGRAGLAEASGAVPRKTAPTTWRWREAGRDAPGSEGQSMGVPGLGRQRWRRGDATRSEAAPQWRNLRRCRAGLGRQRWREEEQRDGLGGRNLRRCRAGLGRQRWRREGLRGSAPVAETSDGAGRGSEDNGGERRDGALPSATAMKRCR